MFINLFSFIVAAINVAVAAVIYLNNRKSNVNRLFAFLIAALAFYFILNDGAYLGPDQLTKVIFSNLAISVLCWIIFIAFVFLSTYPKETSSASKLILIMLAILTFAFSAAAAGGLVVDLNFTPADLFPLFVFYALATFVFGFSFLISKFHEMAAVEKVRVKLLLFAFALLFSLIIIFNFFVYSFFKITDFAAFSPLYLLIFNLIVVYAVLKHKFLDIRFFVVRSLAFSLLLLLIILSYSGNLLLIGSYILGEKPSGESLFATITITIFITLTFGRLKNFIEKVTAKIFFREMYDQEKLLLNLSTIMSSTLYLSELIERILQEIISNMKIKFALVVLMEGNSIAYCRSWGKNPKIELDEKDVNYLLMESALVKPDNSRMLVFDDMAEGKTKQLMREGGYLVVLPLMAEETRIGGIFLGEKITGEIYSDRDLNFLQIVVPQIAISVKNSFLYEQVKNFNKTLEEEVKRATADLESANQHLQELDKLKDEFVSIVSHELRSPMTDIKNALWTVLDEVGQKLPAQQKEFLSHAYASTDVLIKMTNELLNISRIKSGKVKLEKIDFDMIPLAQEVKSEMLKEAEAKQISITIDTMRQFFVYADKDKIYEVLVNLVDNAIKFTNSGGKISIYFEESEDDLMVVTKVQDTGKGMNAEEINKLFRKFGHSEEGTGLGLYICKLLVELHGGKIWAESEGPGKGSTFSFSLPKK